MAFLYVSEQGAVVRKSGDRFLVEKDDRVLADLPYHKLENVLLFGSVQVTTQALGELLEKGVPVSFFSRQGRFRGSLAMPHGHDISLRLAQFDLHRDGARALELSRRVVEAKLANGLEVLDRYARQAGEPERFGELRRGLDNVRQNATTAADLPSLLGMEGSGARAYFDALVGFNRSGMEWPGRVKFPATDPVNALLSLGYTLVCQELAALLEGHGVDPYLGFYHQPDFGRRSLALDLTEVFRHPVVDRLVLALLNRRSFQQEDFTRRGERGGLYLSPEALKRFFDFYERWMLATGGEKRRPSFRKLLGREAAEFVKSLRKEMEFQPFRWVESGDEGEEALWNTLSVTI